MKKALVCGAGGFIGSHLVRRLKKEGYFVRGVDIKYPEFSKTQADEFIKGDLRNSYLVDVCVDGMDEIYQLAADMGGADYIFTGENDSDVMHNSAQINLNIVDSMKKFDIKKIFYSSSACMYPQEHQVDENVVALREDMAYPGNPDSEYGWEKLFSERLYLSFQRNYGLDVRIGRFHNIFGPQGTWDGGKEKAPAAMCRKVCECEEGGEIEVWGDGSQTRSFLYIDECLEAVTRFMRQDSFSGPVNIGSEEMVTINELADLAIQASGKNVKVKNLFGKEFEEKYGHACPLGVKGRNSDNTLYKEKIGWESKKPLSDGIFSTYEWINKKVNEKE